MGSKNLILDTSCILGTYRLISTFSEREFEKIILPEYCLIWGWPNEKAISKYLYHRLSIGTLNENDKKELLDNGPFARTSIRATIEQEKELLLELIYRLERIGRLEITDFIEDEDEKIRDGICELSFLIKKQYANLDEALKDKLLLTPIDFQALAKSCIEHSTYESYTSATKMFIKKISREYKDNNKKLYVPKNLKYDEIESYIDRSKIANKRYGKEIKIHRNTIVAVFEAVIGSIPYVGNVYSVCKALSEFAGNQKRVKEENLFFECTHNIVEKCDINSVALFEDISSFFFSENKSDNFDF